MLGEESGHKYVGHGGWVNGFVSQFNRFPDDDEVLIILWNIETANNFSVSSDLAAIMFGKKYELPVMRPVVHPTPDKLAKYVGDYVVGPLTLQITLRNGKLYAFGGQGQPVPYGLIAVSDTEFYCNDTPTIITFMPDESGNTNQVVIKLGGQVHSCESHGGTAEAGKLKARLNADVVGQSAGAQLLSGLYSDIAEASFSVSCPRSF